MSHQGRIVRRALSRFRPSAPLLNRTLRSASTGTGSGGSGDGVGISGANNNLGASTRHSSSSSSSSASSSSSQQQTQPTSNSSKSRGGLPHTAGFYAVDSTVPGHGYEDLDFVFGEVVDHAVDAGRLRPGDTIDVPYEVSESVSQ